MSRRVRMVLAGLGLVVVAVLCWFFLLSPLREEAAEVQKDIENQQQQLTLMRTTLAQAEATRDEGRRNQARLLELSKMVPPAEELPSLLLQLQDLADQSGIAFIAVTPGRLTSGGEKAAYQTLQLELQFRGAYFDVSDFAYRAEQMVAGPGRLLAFKALSLSPQGASTQEGGVSPLLSVSASMYAFVLTGQESAAAPASSGETPESQ